MSHNQTLPTWTTALPDWEEKIIKGESLVPCKPLFPEVAQIALEFFKKLTLVDVIGSPLMGDITREWVYDFVSVIFGAYNPKVSRERLIKEFFLLISKKNSKSTIAAGIMLTAMVLNDRKNCEMAIVAPTKEVADNSFKPLEAMILADPKLSSMFNISAHTKTITNLITKATLKVVAAENDSLAGAKYTYLLVDELWLFGKRAGASSMLREAKGGLASRPEGFVIYLTTMSNEMPSGVMKEKLDYARMVRDKTPLLNEFTGEFEPVVDNEFLGVLYEFPKTMLDTGKHLDPKNWYITNPNLGASVSERFLVSEFKKAKMSGDKSDLQDFFAKHLNVEIGISLRANRWAGAEFWQSAGADFTLDELIERSEVITIGGDGGGLDDLLGMAVIGRLPSDDDDNLKKWLVWVKAWCHPIALERRKQDEPKYRDFEADGDLVIVETVGDDTAHFAQIAKKVYDSGKLDRIGLDPLGVGGIVDDLLKVGIPQDDKIIGVSQGFKLSGYQKTAERKLASGDLLHANQPIMAWCVGNAQVLVKGSGTMLSKAESGTGKIDPVIAMMNAVALMSENPAPPKSSDDVGVYF